MLDNAKNFAKATVSTGYNNSATSIVLNSGQGALMPAAPFNVVWWNYTDYADPSDDPNVEIVRVTNISGDTLTVVRAQEGTTATNKNTGGKTYKMIAGFTAKIINTDLFPKVRTSGTFENSGRYITIGSGGGTVTFGTQGALINPGSSSGAYAGVQLKVLADNNSAANLFDGNPSFAAVVRPLINAATGEYFIGVGDVAQAGAGHTWSNKHIGFKITAAGGVSTLYATQADGTTENVSPALATIGSGIHHVELLVMVWSGVQAAYYYRIDGGAWTLGATLTANLPTGNTTSAGVVQFSICSNNTTSSPQGYAVSTFYER